MANLISTSASAKLTIYHPRVVVWAFDILPEAGLQLFCHSFVDKVSHLKKKNNSNISVESADRSIGTLDSV